MAMNKAMAMQCKREMSRVRLSCGVWRARARARVCVRVCCVLCCAIFLCANICCRFKI